MKKKAIIILFLLAVILFARKLRYKEEFYRLHYLPQLYDNVDLKRNLFWLEIAGAAPFAPPIQALVICQTPEHYKKYKILVRMHIEYLKTKNEVFLAARFDKHQPLFFNKPYRDQILESLEYAEYHYKNAGNHWKKVLQYKKMAEEYKQLRIELNFVEDIIVRINQGDLDYQRVIDRKVHKLVKTRAFFNS